MKKVFLTAIIVLVIGLTACTGKDNKSPAKSSGSGNSNTPGTSQGSNNKGGGTAIKDISKDNWVAVVKANCGIDISLPDDWTVTEAETINGVSNMKITFTIGGSTTAVNWGTTLFDAAKGVTKRDIYKPSSSSTIYQTFAEANNEAAGMASWVYSFKDSTGSEKLVTLNIFYGGTSFELKLDA